MPKRSIVTFIDGNIVDLAKVNQIKAVIPRDETLKSLASLFQIIGDDTRVKILYAIAENELCVRDICAVLNMSHSAISHQLRILKDARIVKNRREGKNIYYSLDDEHITQIFSKGLEHISELSR